MSIIPDLILGNRTRKAKTPSLFRLTTKTQTVCAGAQCPPSFEGITSDLSLSSPEQSSSQDRRSSGLATSTSYAASEAEGSIVTDDTAMGTGQAPLH